MKWVLGTGRCGMKNYTVWKNGFIDSSPALRSIAVKKFHRAATDYDMEIAKRIILERSLLKVNSVADCCQFMFIELIQLVDPGAEFVWLKRERAACIRSFLDRPAEEQRIHPEGWEFRADNKPELISWYYDTVNKIIEEGLVGKKFEQFKTEEMPLLVAL